LTHQKDRFFSI